MNNQKFYTNVKQYGNNILYMGYDENGNRVKEKIPFQPTLYVQSQNDQPQDAVCYDGTPVRQMEFSSIKEAKDFIKQYSDVSNFKLYGIDKFAYEYIARNFRNAITYSTALIRVFYLDIETLSPEDGGFPDAYTAEQQITAITIYDSKTEKFYTWGYKHYDPNKTYENDPIAHIRGNIVYRRFKNEMEMLADFISFWKNNFPDVVTGWYSRGFDIPFILNRVKRIFGEKVMNSLSPWGIIQEKVSNIKRFGVTSSEIQYELYGIAELDLLDLYKKYGGENEESFKLGYIAQKHLGFTKIEYEGSLNELYERDPQTYFDYNIQDVNCVVGLEKLKKLVQLIIKISYFGKVGTYNDTLGSIKYWEIYAYNYLRDKGQVTEIKPEMSLDKDTQYEGAYVKEPIIGLHEWIMTFDFASLYPKTIQQTNIGPETLVDKATLPDELKELLSKVTVDRLVNKELDLSLLKKYNYSLSANGQLYRRDKISFFSEIIDDLFNKRKQYKKEMIENKKKYQETKEEHYKDTAEQFSLAEQGVKTLINGLYGNFGNGFFQYFSIPNAEAVTLNAQVAIKLIRNAISKYLDSLLKTDDIDRVIAIDTDSLFLNLSEIIKAVFVDDKLDKVKVVDFLDSLSKEKLKPIIEKECEDFCTYLNGVNNCMDMKREKIADRGIWTAKKRYCMNVYDSEGVRYKDPEIYITGLQAISTSIPGVCRNALEDCLKILMQGSETELQQYVLNFKTKFKKMELEKIALPRGIGDIGKFVSDEGYRKGTGIHFRAAINYNKLITEKKLKKKYSEIKADSKMKFLHLKMPNIIQDNVIGFVDKLPKEFELEKYVDYEEQFEKTFLNSLQTLTDLINWKTEEEWSLDS